MAVRSRNQIRACLVQFNAGSNLRKNLERLERILLKAYAIRPDFIALPENFAWRGVSSDLSKTAKASPDILARFQAIAKAKKSAFLLGSLLETSNQPGQFYNTAYWISREGRLVSKYRKIHLFDVVIPGCLKVRESKHILSGNALVMVKVKGVPAGLSICYDLRFPELYRKLSAKGAKILFVPANFTYETGKAHWEVLLKARAVENLCFVVAPGQVGRHPESGIRSFGKSLILDPWGRVLAEASSKGEEVLWADLDLVEQGKLRQSFPVLQHRRLG